MSILKTVNHMNKRLNLRIVDRVFKCFTNNSYEMSIYTHATSPDKI